jgi:hypothetical protein
MGGRLRQIANLEDSTAIRDGKQIKETDFNFWGVTFARDSNRFYRTYLVEGDVRRAECASSIGEASACPSLSPYETRIAFNKKRTTQR